MPQRRPAHQNLPRAAAWPIFALAGAISAFAPLNAIGAEINFTRDVEPILKAHCLDCHGPDKQKSKFRIDRRSLLLAGGDLGEPAVIPGEPDKSFLIQAVSGTVDDLVMPPKGKRLSDDQVSTLREWIAQGASTPTSYGADKERNQPTHWSLKPVVRPTPPSFAGASDGNEIDAFVRRKLTGKGLSPSQQAERRKLIRRLGLVMHGLPPNAKDVDAFVANSDPQAWLNLVNDALKSPRYGERWAQHWLDLVRFGETHGFETNRERPNAWPYRDWIIDAFNTDKPYDRFVREQVAGDMLGEPVGVGFLVAGPHDLVKGKDPLLRLTQRQDELADMINTTGTAFLGLTLGCARCHNHKFDPVTQKDFYSLQAVFAGVEHADRAMPLPKERNAKIATIDAQIAKLRERLQKFVRKSDYAHLLIDDAQLAKSAGIGVEQLEKPRGKGKNPKGAQPGFADDPGSDKRMPNISGGEYTWWNNLPGKDVAAYRPLAQGRFRVWLSWGAGHATHTRDARFLIDADGETTTTNDRKEIARVDQQLLADGSGKVINKSLWSGFWDAGIHEFEPTAAIVLQGGQSGSAITADALLLEPVANETANASPPARPNLRPALSPKHNIERFPPTEARFIRFTIERSSSSEPCIDELEIFSGNQNVALAHAGAKASSSGDFVHPVHKLAHINDGKYGNTQSWISKSKSGGWVQIELTKASRIDRIEWGRDREGRFTDRLPVEYRIEAATKLGQWTLLASSADRLPASKGKTIDTTYDFARHTPDIAKQGRQWLTVLTALSKNREKLTKPTMIYAGKFTQPGPTHRLYRGEPMAKREQVEPNAIEAIGALSLKKDSPEKERRLALAKWIADRDNPLTARVIVNRLWQFHFGVGIVDTPSDFGANGTPPTHPELLDWLASELMDKDWSLKHIHRLILTSATWRQDSRPQSDALRIDGATRLLWRFPPRRLEAEAIRDCLLLASGVLDLKSGGPGFSAFEIEPENVRHYFPKKSFGPEDWRRMVYMTKVRQEKDSVFGVFDCPDASQVVPKRSRSTTPLQALNLLNSIFVNQQAELLAKRLHTEAGESTADQIKLAFTLCFGRDATADELKDAEAFIKAEGLHQFTRALLNANEFVFIP
jgi:mono/diheme cytochrome c family protein